MSRRGWLLFAAMGVIWGIPYLNPAVAAALGVLVLGEHLTPAIAASFVLILGGSVLATQAGGRAPVMAGDRATGVRSD